MSTDTSERGLERLICTAMTGQACDPPQSGVDAMVGQDWIGGNPDHYSRDYCIDLFQLTTFLKQTQPEVAEALDLDNESPTRHKFLSRLQGEISKRGTIEILRHGLSRGQYHLDLFYGTPSAGNPDAQQRYQTNRFSLTRQLHYSQSQKGLSLDLALFINGLPVATLELKNSLTKQTVADAIWQYKNDRNPREKLFEFGRCLVHFAVDDQQVWFCTHLKGKASWFLPFNKGWNDAAGNPPNPDGIKTDYLWKETLSRDSLTNILEQYAQIVVEKDAKTGKEKKLQIWPRYHQLRVVRDLLRDVSQNGVGQCYLIQHSAGSGKSNSIAWLAHQLIGLEQDQQPIIDSIIVVTDRRLLDRQIRETIKQYAQVNAIIGAVTGDGASKTSQLTDFLESGKKIIISTVQTFPHVLDRIGLEHRGRRFAIIIDEAHSSQGGKATRAMAQSLSESGVIDEDELFEDKIIKLMESRKLLPNASYFAFTATPKNKTLQMFGAADPQPEVGRISHHPFDSYTMKQAIQEGFIMDVLQQYTPVESYYKLVKTVQDDPEFDSKKARKKLSHYVEGHERAIQMKAEIMVDHFHEQVLGQRKVGGQARAMVITSGIQRAIQYYHAIRDYLVERKSQYQAIVAFSGEPEYGGKKVTETLLNGFPASQIADTIQQDPYRFLICADKFQTGYDEPLLHSMYVDKPLSGIKAVQTLSRLNRAHPQKHDVFVLDFYNDIDEIKAAFDDYYRTTILADEADPDRLHDLQSDLDGYQVYSAEQVDQLVRLYLDDAERDQLDPILDSCVGVYQRDLDENGQIDFKAKAKTFIRTYNFLASVLPYTNAGWEKRSIFLNFLVPKLPAPQEEDLSRGILDAIDMDSYRVEKQAMQKIQLIDADAEIDPVPTTAGGHLPEPEMDRLSNIIKVFNDLFGNIDWQDADRVHQLVTEVIPARVAKDNAYQNAQQHSDQQNARIEHDKALLRVMTGLMRDDLELFKQFMDNQDFKTWMTNTSFTLTYEQPH